MSTKSTVNIYRRKLLRTLTKNVGHTPDLTTLDLSSVHKIFISRPNNRLGNQLLLTPLIQEVSTLFPNCKIDIFVRGGVANALFCNYPQVNHLLKLPSKPFKQLGTYIYIWFRILGKRYDLAINAIENSSSGRLSTRLARAKYKIYNDIDTELLQSKKDYCHIAKRPVYNLRKLLSKNEVERPIPTLSIQLSDEEKRKGSAILKQLFGNDRETICIYTFATGNKCFSKTWWASLYDELMKKYSDTYNIIEILPKENVSQIDFKATSYYSLDIREIAAVMANTILYIGADCGIMHLASAAGIRTMGLFSVTSIDRYMPYGNNSIAIDVNNSPIEKIIQSI
jgi:heptosyltransferase-3